MDTVKVSTTGLATCLAERDALRARNAEMVAALNEARDALALARAGAMPSMNLVERIDAALAKVSP